VSWQSRGQASLARPGALSSLAVFKPQSLGHRAASTQPPQTATKMTATTRAIKLLLVALAAFALVGLFAGEVQAAPYAGGPISIPVKRSAADTEACYTASFAVDRFKKARDGSLVVSSSFSTRLLEADGTFLSVFRIFRAPSANKPLGPGYLER